MSLKDELFIKKILKEVLVFISKFSESDINEENANKEFQKVVDILLKDFRNSFSNFSWDTLIWIAETSIKIPKQRDFANQFIELYFNNVKSEGQFHIRALIFKASLLSQEGFNKGLKSMDNIRNSKNAINYVFEALDLISKPENKIKYNFLIYNASICIYNIIRNFFRKNWLKHFVDITERVYNLLEGSISFNLEWKARFSWLYLNCLYDDGKKNEAIKILDKIWDSAKKINNFSWFDNLLKQRIYFLKDNNSALNSLKNELEKNFPETKGYSYAFILNSIKFGAVPENNIEKDLNSLISNINPTILTNHESLEGDKLPLIKQEVLAEAAKVAVSFNIIGISKAILNYLQKIGQANQKIFILTEYTRAEILVKDSGPLNDFKLGTKLTAKEIREQDIERRIEALDILSKTIQTDKNLSNPDLIYEGCCLIWNFSLPFLNSKFKHKVTKVFKTALEFLEEINSPDYELRVKMNLELAKINITEDLGTTKRQLNKALELDYSNIGKIERPYDSELYFLLNKSNIKDDIKEKNLNLVKIMNIIKKLENAKKLDNNFSTTHQNKKKSELIDAFKELISIKEEKGIKSGGNLVKEEIEIINKNFQLEQIEIYKKKKKLCFEICEIAKKLEMNDLVLNAGNILIQDIWDNEFDTDLIVNQILCYFLMADTLINKILESGHEFAFTESIKINSNDINDLLNENDKVELLRKKKQFIDYFQKSIDLAEQSKQYWLIFNGAIVIWNKYLPIFKNPLNDNKLLPECIDMLKNYFEKMKNSIKDIEKKIIIDYDLDNKIQVFGNIGIIYSRLIESQKKFDEVLKVAETLLLAPLTPHTRKIVNSIKARIGGTTKGNQQKNEQIGQNNNDLLLHEIVSQIEKIQNNTDKKESSNLIIKCFEKLNLIKFKEDDEIELEMKAELFTKLSSLSLNIDNILMYKYSIKCANTVINENNNKKIPLNRLRWYSLSNFLYAQALIKLSNSTNNTLEIKEKILFDALNHSLEGVKLGSESNKLNLILDNSKLFTDICNILKNSSINRKKMIEPIFKLLYYIQLNYEYFQLNINKELDKDLKDLIFILTNILFVGCIENEEWILGEKSCDLVWNLIHNENKKIIWIKKIEFLARQGKNETIIANNIKECDSLSQAKVWLKLARTSNTVSKQFNSFNNAIDILKNDSNKEIVFILIEFTEWLLRNKYEKNIIKENLNMAIDILSEDEIKQNEEKMNATVTKTIKSQNSSKNLNNDNNLENLNIKNLDQMIRIYYMQASISENQDEQINFLQEIRFFINLIFKRTISQINLNEINNVNSNSNNKDNNIKKENNEEIYKNVIKFPQSIKEWIEFDFPDSFVKLIENNNDHNIFCKVSFEYPEITINYIEKSSIILENYGLINDCLILLIFNRFYGKYILKNDLLYVYYSNKIKRLSNLNLNIKNIKILSNQEQEFYFNNLKRSYIKTINENISKNTPLIINEFKDYEIWIKISIELIKNCNFIESKFYLEESIKHAIYIGNKENIGLIKMYLSLISFKNGRMRDLKWLMESHKLIKSYETWKLNIEITTEYLLELNKLDDLKDFIKQIKSTFLKIKENKENYENDLIDINEIIILLNLMEVKRIFKLLKNNQFEINNLQDYIENFNFFVKKIIEIYKDILDLSKIFFSFKLIKIFIEINEKIINFLNRRSSIKRKNIIKKYKFYFKVSSILNSFDFIIQKNLKFILVYKDNQDYNPLYSYYIRFKILLSELYLNCEILQNYIPSSINSNLLFEKSISNQQSFISSLNYEDFPDKTRKYLNNLDEDIKKMLKPLEKDLNSYDKVINLMSNIIEDNLFSDKCKLILLKANVIKYIKNYHNFDDDIEIQEKVIDEEKKEKLWRIILNLINHLKPLLIQNESIFNFYNNNFSFKNKELFCYSVLDFLSNKNDYEEFNFEMLVYLQKSLNDKYFYDTIQKYSCFEYNLNLILRIYREYNNNYNKNEKIKEKLQAEIKNEQIFELFNYSKSYEEIFLNLDICTGYLIIQFDSSMDNLYIGVGYKDFNEEHKCHLIKKENSNKVIEKLLLFNNEFQLYKIKNQRNSLLVEKEENEFYNEYKIYINQFLNNIKGLFENEIIEIEEFLKNQEDNFNNNINENEKEDKKVKKSDNLPKKSHFLEIFFLCLDLRIFDIPFENLEIFSKAKIVSKDISLFHINKKIDSMKDYQLIKEDLSYLSNKFNKEELNINDICSNKIKEINENNYEPSFSEVQTIVSNSNFLLYYSNKSILKLINFNEVLKLKNNYNNKIFVNFDKINTLKKYMNKNKDYAQCNLKNIIKIIDYSKYEQMLFSYLGNCLNLNLNISIPIKKIKLIINRIIYNIDNKINITDFNDIVGVNKEDLYAVSIIGYPKVSFSR